MKRTVANRLTCQRHKPFATEVKAYRYLLERMRAGKVDPGTHTFRCGHCWQWHIGGGVNSLERAIRQARGEDR